MKVLATITPKFQVQIPVSIRKKIGLEKHGRAYIKAEKEKIIIEPITSNFLSLAGKYQTTKPVPAEKIREHLEYSK